MTKQKYECGLCGKRRRVITKPKSKCVCMTDFPNKHMYFKVRIIDSFVWVWQHFKLLFRRRWKLVK